MAQAQANAQAAGLPRVQNFKASQSAGKQGVAVCRPGAPSPPPDRLDLF